MFNIFSLSLSNAARSASGLAFSDLQQRRQDLINRREARRDRTAHLSVPKDLARR